MPTNGSWEAKCPGNAEFVGRLLVLAYTFLKNRKSGTENDVGIFLGH